MVNAKQCDRCGKLYAQRIVQQIQMPLWNPNERYTPLHYWDICDECAEEFMDFMNHKSVNDHA